MRKPRVNDVNKWYWTTWNTNDYDGLKEVAVGVADNYPDYYKVLISKSGKAERPKYFYGESAWSDVNRYVNDETGWIWFDLSEGGEHV